jgi:hypothetical protein
MTPITFSFRSLLPAGTRISLGMRGLPFRLIYPLVLILSPNQSNLAANDCANASSRQRGLTP